MKKKDFYGIGKTADVDPFGISRAFKLGGNTLWWTEGEFDAIALDYCLTLAGGGKSYPVISLTHGGGSLRKNFERVEDRIEKYEHHVFVLDDDETGHLAEKAAIELLGSKAVILSKPNGAKDANDAVKAGHALEMGSLALNFTKK